MLTLPLNPEIRELFEVEDIVDYRNLPTFRQLLDSLRRTVSQPDVRAAHGICLRANDEVWLVRVGKRGGWKRVWNFGNPRKQYAG